MGCNLKTNQLPILKKLCVELNLDIIPQYGLEDIVAAHYVGNENFLYLYSGHFRTTPHIKFNKFVQYIINNTKNRH